MKNKNLSQKIRNYALSGIVASGLSMENLNAQNDYELIHQNSLDKKIENVDSDVSYFNSKDYMLKPSRKEEIFFISSLALLISSFAGVWVYCLQIEKRINKYKQKNKSAQK